jgi:hypothetical protein
MLLGAILAGRAGGRFGQTKYVVRRRGDGQYGKAELLVSAGSGVIPRIDPQSDRRHEGIKVAAIVQFDDFQYVLYGALDGYDHVVV